MEKRPDWLKVRIPGGDTFFEVRRILQSHKLNTICEDAMCPNIAECWGTHRTATFMILGDVCTRACAFCAVTSGKPTELDLAEPARVAAAIADLKLRHAVITSVDRDDLVDGGAVVFADLVHQIRRRDPDVKIELLTPDFQGSLDAVRLIANAGPDIFSHNIETARRLYPTIRFKSDYDRSFGLLKSARQMNPRMFIKTGIMVGLGEDTDEVREVMCDALSAGVDIFTIGTNLPDSGSMDCGWVCAGCLPGRLSAALITPKTSSARPPQSFRISLASNVLFRSYEPVVVSLQFC
jgi:lipoic acid synthetase